MKGYSEFKSDIIISFKDLINEFNLQLQEPYKEVYQLIGENCIIHFTYDRGETGCNFEQINKSMSTRIYPVNAIYKFLYPNEVFINSTINDDYYNPKSQLAKYAGIIQAKLKNVLNGDFSWVRDYLANEKKEGQWVTFILDLGRDHAISKKYWNGDVTWKADAEKFLLQNNITLPDSPWH